MKAVAIVALSTAVGFLAYAKSKYNNQNVFITDEMLFDNFKKVLEEAKTRITNGDTKNLATIPNIWYFTQSRMSKDGYDKYQPEMDIEWCEFVALVRQEFKRKSNL
jgi:hypothetical protein